MFKRQIVNAHHEWARHQRRRRELHMKDVYRIAAQLGAQCYRYAYNWSVRQSSGNGKVGPASAETLYGRAFGDVKRIVIGGVDFGKRLDEIDGVRFITGQLSAN